MEFHLIKAGQYLLLILITYAPLIEPRIDSVQDKDKSVKLMPAPIEINLSKNINANLTNSKIEEKPISKTPRPLRQLAIYYREWNSSTVIPKCSLTSSRCLRWIHWNLLTCSTFVKQTDWYQSCILKRASTDQGRILLNDWWAKSKLYHKGIFDCFSTSEDRYAFDIKMPLKQIIEDAPAIAMCLKYHKTTWDECVSSATALSCSKTNLCWRNDSVQVAKNETEKKLEMYYQYLTAFCRNRTIEVTELKDNTRWR